MNDAVRQNLLAAGCDEAFIAAFEGCMPDSAACERMLAAHRRALLDDVHEKERCISCLDYLMFMMRKEGLR
ncbi:MAG: hypothetical protein II723_03330 [Oscillospiraceae bacterium]|nr:hypothetical protein [Oscillospiraceae bacterium]